MRSRKHQGRRVGRGRVSARHSSALSVSRTATTEVIANVHGVLLGAFIALLLQTRDRPERRSTATEGLGLWHS